MKLKRRTAVKLYFVCWLIASIICMSLNIVNIRWTHTGLANGLFVVVLLGILQTSVLEFPMQTMVTIFIGGRKRKKKRAVCDHLTVLLNYNLLATSRSEINDCMLNMFSAYIGNLGSNVAAVLVSATPNNDLKDYELQVRDQYRNEIYKILNKEGIYFCKGEYEKVDPIHMSRVWKPFRKVDKKKFLDNYLKEICTKYSNDFMVVHRVSRVLRKCGQYQDLMLLSDGFNEAFTYCDPVLYDKSARKCGEPLFHASEDVSNLHGRKFDYTLVLDSDSGVPKATLFDIMEIAAAHPEKAIIQPAIKLHCQHDDSAFMHIDCMRQSIFEPMTNAMTTLLSQSSFFGKGLIKNRAYIDQVIGTKEYPIERVPIDVLSHDTFEAALLRPLYAGSVYLLESPCHNFVSWNIRERRWNKGELITAMYFWKNIIGRPMRFLQKHIQGTKFNNTKLRTETKLNFVTSYIAHSAFRHMLVKPLLFVYVCIHLFLTLSFKHPYISVIVVMFCVLVFPKFATCNRNNFKYVLLETIISIFQFTPEAVVGTVRLCRAVYGNISLNAKWRPQQAVEDEIKISNPFICCFKELWGYSLFATISSVLILVFIPHGILAFVMTFTVFVLPLFSGMTSLSPSIMRCERKKEETDQIVETAFSTMRNNSAFFISGVSIPSELTTNYTQSSVSLSLEKEFQNKAISQFDEIRQRRNNMQNYKIPSLFDSIFPISRNERNYGKTSYISCDLFPQDTASERFGSTGERSDALCSNTSHIISSSNFPTNSNVSNSANLSAHFPVLYDGFGYKLLSAISDLTPPLLYLLDNTCEFGRDTAFSGRLSKCSFASASGNQEVINDDPKNKRSLLRKHELNDNSARQINGCSFSNCALSNGSELKKKTCITRSNCELALMY